MYSRMKRKCSFMVLVVMVVSLLMVSGMPVHADDYGWMESAREQILNFIDEFKIDLVIGSSLGGFITLTLNGIPRFVINPCWDPPVELCKLVEQDAAFTKMIMTYMPYEIWIAKSVNYQEKMLVKEK